MSRLEVKPRPEARCAGGGASNRRQNTPSTRTKTVTVCYPFHPRCGEELEVFTWRSTDGNSVTVLDAGGRGLRIPYWMLCPEAKTKKILPQAAVSTEALISLCELLAVHAKLTAGASGRPQESEHEATESIQCGGTKQSSSRRVSGRRRQA